MWQYLFFQVCHQSLHLFAMSKQLHIIWATCCYVGTLIYLLVVFTRVLQFFTQASVEVYNVIIIFDLQTLMSWLLTVLNVAACFSRRGVFKGLWWCSFEEIFILPGIVILGSDKRWLRMVRKRQCFSRRNRTLGNISPGSKNLLWESSRFQQLSAALNSPWDWLCCL